MQTRYFDRFLLATLSADETTSLAAVEPSRYLAPSELLRDESISLPSARRQFRAGRIALKTAILAVKNSREAETIALEDAFRRDDYAALEIGSRDDRNRGVAPKLCDDASRGSISHIATAAVAAYPLSSDDALGGDVVEFGSVRRNMLDLFFTESERAALNEPDVWATDEQDVVWAAKEAAYKAVSCELPFKPNLIEVEPDGDGRYRVRVEGVELPAFVVDRDQRRAVVVAVR